MVASLILKYGNNMNDLKKNKTKEMILVSFMLIFSSAVWLVVPYAQHLANGRDIEWNNYIGKGIIVSIVCLAVYLLADKYGKELLKKCSKAILYIGTALLLGFAIFESPLSRIEIPILSKTIAYAYAALPFLEIITLCALTVNLNDILSGDFKSSKLAMVTAGTVMTCLLNDVFKVILLIYLIIVLTNLFIKKKEYGKTAAIVSVLSVCLLAYSVYVCSKGLQVLIGEWNNRSFMAYVSRNVWEHAKLFGTMDNLKIAGGSIYNFSLLWLIGFLGIIPTAFIVAALIFLVCVLLKKRDGKCSANSIKELAIIYFCIRLFFAALANCGIVLVGLMTPVPMVMDTVSGMLCSFLLLGLLCSSGGNRVNATSD